jgi:hypothetical protein
MGVTPLNAGVMACHWVCRQRERAFGLVYVVGSVQSVYGRQSCRPVSAHCDLNIDFDLDIHPTLRPLILSHPLSLPRSAPHSFRPALVQALISPCCLSSTPSPATSVVDLSTNEFISITSTFLPVVYRIYSLPRSN